MLENDSEVEIVAECANGREAVEAIKSLKPDLVFLDIQMPELGGFEVLESFDRESNSLHHLRNCLRSVCRARLRGTRVRLPVEAFR